MKIDSDILEEMLGSDITTGDDIVISTIKGSKTITLTRAGVFYNILNALDPTSSWFQLIRGENIFYYSTESGSANLQIRIEHDIVYEGI